MTSNMIYIVAVGIGFKCPCKIHLNTPWGRGQKCGISDDGQVQKIAVIGEEGVKNSEISADLLYG